LDISVSATALVLGAPVLALIALIIRLDSPGPVLFKQPATGLITASSTSINSVQCAMMKLT
jgi:lipopolysaccharide/colanic/teichoic acid biosynthesis glycosyltransferase